MTEPMTDAELDALLALGSPLDDIPHSQTPQGVREAEIDRGFTGTLAACLGWIDAMMMNGDAILSAHPEPDEARPGTFVRRLELITGGYSTAEHLCERVRSSLLGWRYWESSHRGGLFVYLLPETDLASSAVCQWVSPLSPDEPFERLPALTRLRVEPPGGAGDPVVAFPDGVELAAEVDRDHPGEPGTLVVRPMTPRG